MNREHAKELLPIIQAFAEGKTIQIRKHGEECYYDSTNSNLNFALEHYDYRIKPEPKYRPFANADECWQEMQKHQPFGWIKASHGKFLIIGFKNNEITFGTKDNWQDYNYIFKSYIFADGTPFGIKEE